MQIDPQQLAIFSGSLLICLFGGFLVAWWIQKYRLIAREEGTQLNQKLQEAVRKLARFEGSEQLQNTLLGEQENTITELRDLLANSEKQLATKESEHKSLEQRLREKQKEIEDMYESMKQNFELLSRKILDDTSKKFTEQNSTRIQEIVTPLQRSIQDFRGKVEESQKDQASYHGQLKSELQHLREANKRITSEAENLVHALKGDSKSQGVWGEMILETLLEKSGLTKGIEYDTQVSVSDQREGGGQRLRPDVLVWYPQQKGCLVIDSKVSLTAYERYCSAETPEEKQRALSEHITSLRTHIRGLSKKNYQNLKGFNSPDFVLLFIPIEPALGVAQGHDTKLYDDAFAANIVLITPSTLLATLRLIRHLWIQERQNENALKIAERGGKLYDKFVTLFEEIEKLSQQIDKSADACRNVKNLIRDGHGNLYGQMEKIRSLGAKAQKALPPGEDVS
ncbi:MAG: DNA recombination protein RmuC [Chthoniobacterales bacterium]